MFEISTKRYVYFDQEGNIKAISNNIDEAGNYIEVELDDVMDFITGKKTTFRYLVAYDTLTKRHLIKPKEENFAVHYSVDREFHKLSKSSYEKNDINVIRKAKSNIWNFSLHPELRKYLTSQVAVEDKNLLFYFTIKNNPQALIHTLSINLKHLIEEEILEIKIDEIKIHQEISVFTKKKFETYNYEVIND